MYGLASIRAINDAAARNFRDKQAAAANEAASPAAQKLARVRASQEKARLSRGS